MALNAVGNVEVRTTGDDTNGGGFSTVGNVSSFSATGGTTTAPEITSAVAFVAGDVGYWLFIKGGTNWNTGWYEIVSVAAGLATVNATAGQWVSFIGNTPVVLGTVDGIATVSSPTGGTGMIDYCQHASPIVSASDLVVDAVVNTRVSSASRTFTSHDVGNYLQITSGLTAGVYEITSITGASANLDRSPGTVGSTGGVFKEGGAFASPGMAGSIAVSGMNVWVKSGTYTLTSSTSNVAGGRITSAGGTAGTNICKWEGFNTYRTDKGTRPVISAGAVTGITIFTGTGSSTIIDNFILDCEGGATMTGYSLGGNRSAAYRVKVIDSTVIGSNLTADGVNVLCEVTGHSGTSAFSTSSGNWLYCEAYDGTTSAFVMGSTVGAIIGCIADTNTGASSDGFQLTGRGHQISRSISYGSGRHGFNAGANGGCSFDNCIAENSGGWGWTNGAVAQNVILINCAGYNNTSGDITSAIFPDNFNFVSGTASFFTDAANGDFTLNNNAGGGALLRATGFPGTLTRAIGQGYSDRGPYQHQDSGGGGTTIEVHGPAMIGL